MKDKNDSFENEYESVDDSSERNEKFKSGIRFARFLLLLIMVLSALVLLFANKNKISVDNFKRLAAKIDIGMSSAAKTDKAQIDFDYDSSSVIGVYKDGIARVTTDSLSIIDNMGTQFQNVLTGFNTPALITTDKYVLAYDRGGNKLIVTNSFTVLFEELFEDNIVNVNINSNGYIVVITESQAYKNKLIVYDSEFKVVYKINSMSRYFISADISDNNKYIAVSALYVENNNVLPQVVYYKLTSEESVWNFDYQDSVAVSVTAKNDGSVLSLFEWGISIVDSKGKEKYRFEFGNKILQCCHIDDGRYNVVVLSESQSGNSEIYVFDNNGKKIADIMTDYNVLSVDVCSDRIVTASIDKIFIYTASGKKISDRPNTNDGSMVLFSDKNSVLSISSSNVVYNVIN